MAPQTATQSQRETQSENAMECIRAQNPGALRSRTGPRQALEFPAPVLAELLADPEVITAAKHWPDCVPANGRAENLLFYEDPDYGFAINGLTKGEARQGQRARIHDHAHIYTLYGVLDGHERVVRYDRLDDRSRPDYAEIRESCDVPGRPWGNRSREAL